MTADLGFVHRWVPATRAGAPTLLLLHGTGGTEEDLLPLGELLAPGAAMLSPRGQVLERGAPRFFRRLAEGVFDVPDLKARAGDLARFVERAATEYGFTPGSAGAPVIRDGDTVRAKAESDAESASAQFGAATKELPAIIGNVKTIRAELDSSGGTIGAMMNGGVQRAPIQSAMANMGRLRRRLSDGRGSIDRIMDGDLGARAQRVVARADSVRALVGSSNTSLGRFRRDSTLMTEVADIRDELAKVRASLAESRGTAGRMVRDSAVFSALGEVHREMTLLLADLKKHPLRYNPF